MELFTPRSVIAGRLSGVSYGVASAVRTAAQTVLGTDSVAVIYTHEKGVAWYLAIPLNDLSSHLQSACPLACALPAAPGHKGEGAYVLELATDLQAVVIKKADSLISFVGPATMVQRFLTLEGVTATHTCQEPGLTWLLPPPQPAARQKRIFAAGTYLGLAVATLGCSAWLWASLEVQELSRQAADYQAIQRASTKSVVQAIPASSYPPALANLQIAVEQAAREGGALVQFEHQGGHSSWSVNIDGRIVFGAGK